jgi:hypothetical protein
MSMWEAFNSNSTSPRTEIYYGVVSHQLIGSLVYSSVSRDDAEQIEWQCNAG